MEIKDGTLILSEWDLKMILLYIGMCAESCSAGGEKVEKMDFIELFKDSLENNIWLNDLEDVKYDKIELTLAL